MNIFDSYGQDGSLVKIAAETCWDSSATTKRDADGFIRMLKKNRHLSALEFSWFPILITIKDDEEFFGLNIKNIIIQTFKYFKYMEISNIKGKGTNVLLISGNGRAWLEVLEEVYEHSKKYTNKSSLGFHWKLFTNIHKKLYQLNNTLFTIGTDEELMSRIAVPSFTSIDIEVVDERYVRQLDTKLRCKHDWFMLKTKCSIGMTREGNRHRVLSVNERSTRYVDNSNFSVIFPFEMLDKYYDDLDVLNRTKVDILDYIEHSKQIYTQLKADGVPKDIIRQLLPLGIETEICYAGTIKHWKHFIHLRYAKGVHWEIFNHTEKMIGILIDKCICLKEDIL